MRGLNKIGFRVLVEYRLMFTELNIQLCCGVISLLCCLREDIKTPTYKPHTNHKRSSVRSHTLAPTSICDLSDSLCWRPLTDLGHISSVTYVCHPLWFVCGHRKGILTSPLTHIHNSKHCKTISKPKDSTTKTVICQMSLCHCAAEVTCRLRT